MSGPQHSPQRQRLVADLPEIEERMKRERVFLTDLAREYDLSVPGIRKAIRMAGFTERLGKARRIYFARKKADERRQRSLYFQRLDSERIRRLAVTEAALAEGERPVDIARKLNMDLGNFSRLVRQHLRPQTKK